MCIKLILDLKEMKQHTVNEQTHTHTQSSVIKCLRTSSKYDLCTSFHYVCFNEALHGSFDSFVLDFNDTKSLPMVVLSCELVHL